MMKFLIKYYVRKELLNLKGSKLGQILRADYKTGFHRLGHICPFLGTWKTVCFLNPRYIKTWLKLSIREKSKKNFGFMICTYTVCV